MKNARRRLNARLLCGAGAAAILAMSGAARAEVRQFDIPAQSLGEALARFGSQSDLAIVSTSELTRAKSSQPVSGAVEPEIALAQLLTGTGLTYRREGDTFLIVSASDPQSGSAAGDGAEGTVQALIVTAQKREENIQDVPIAMSAFSQEDLTRSQVAGGPDLMTQVPNFTFTKTNFSGYSIQIRGIGTQAISATTDPAVAVAFNNTPFIRNHFFEQEFYDLERVEVLRGPQGTLYGRNATAGVVNIISAKPKNRFEAKLSGDLANYNSSRLEGMINLPLVEDKAALRIAGEWTKRDGFVKNLLTGQQTDGRDLWSVRATLGLTPTDSFKANLIYEHFGENDDRLRSGKQLCNKDPGPDEVDGVPVPHDSGSALWVGDNYLSQGCKPASLYSPDSFETPNGHSLSYYGPIGQVGSPVYQDLDPYLHGTQSRNLREIETHIKPEYTASADVVELQLQVDLPHNLTLASETAFSRDKIFSFEDYNRFDTTPGVFVPGGQGSEHADLDLIDSNGVFCDPQLGCTNRLAAGDLSTAASQQFSQEFRLSSSFDGPFNFSLGANFLRYDTEDKYYVFINSLTAFPAAVGHNYYGSWIPGVSDNHQCLTTTGSYYWANPNVAYQLNGCMYIDPNDIHHLNDEGRNYFLSRNPYHLLSYAAFGEVYYQISPDVRLTAGLRWTVDRKQAPQIPGWLFVGGTYGTPTRKVIEEEWREPTGRLALDWKPTLSFTDQTLVYGSFVHGYKAGGANPPVSVVTLVYAQDGDAIVQRSLAHPETFDPEFVNAYEVGTKNTLLNGQLTFNLGGFYYDYIGYQISQIVDRSAVNLNFDAKIWGMELESDWRARENLRFGVKIGYENTRLADGSKAIDLMDRTAGNPDWVVFKPFPPMPSNCVLPTWLVARAVGTYFSSLCGGYLVGVDPITNLPYVPNPTVWKNAGGEILPLTGTIGGMNVDGYPGFDPSSANNGEGFEKDLSGNALPNAPKITATITADYTLPLPNEWLMTLHTDLYYQSEAWTRIFDTPGYDKLKAYNNINLAAIFSNEASGWNIMAYVKNVLNRDSITGAFLNSDDTGLTTNVFLTEPRLYGLRVTKQWTGESPLGGLFGSHVPGQADPMTIEFGGDYGIFSHGHDLLSPSAIANSPPDFVGSADIQKDLDWGSASEVRFTYTPRPMSWWVSAGARYGRASGSAEAHPKGRLPARCFSFYGRYVCGDPSTGQGTINGIYHITSQSKYNYITATSSNQESHAIVDFVVGKDVGLGLSREIPLASKVSAGLSYAQFRSASGMTMHGTPDMYLSLNPYDEPSHAHRIVADMRANRDFEGAGPVVAWEGALKLAGDSEKSGEIDVELGAGASVLFGKQKTHTQGQIEGSYLGGPVFPKYDLTPAYTTPLNFSRAKSATVPSLQANVGLSYTVGAVKVSGGYRAERYFKVIDGGISERKTYDRDISAAYFKVSVGFGG